jgi:hypothetical protein
MPHRSTWMGLCRWQTVFQGRLTAHGISLVCTIALLQINLSAFTSPINPQASVTSQTKHAVALDTAVWPLLSLSVPVIQRPSVTSEGRNSFRKSYECE